MAVRKKQKQLNSRPEDMELVLPPVPPIPVVPSVSKVSMPLKATKQPIEATEGPKVYKATSSATESLKEAKESILAGKQITADDARFMKVVFAVLRAYESESHVYPSLESFKTLEGAKWALEMDKTGIKTRNLEVKDSQELLFVAKSLPFKSFEGHASIQDACYKYINCIG